MIAQTKIVKGNVYVNAEDVEVEVPLHTPDGWTPENSIQLVNEKWGNFNKLSKELLRELWIARDTLKRPGTRKDINPNQMTWQDYLEHLDMSRTTVHRWLKLYDFEKDEVIQPPNPERERKSDVDIPDPILKEIRFFNIEIECPECGFHFEEDTTTELIRSEIKKQVHELLNEGGHSDEIAKAA